jgi:prophage maintenance system killer protein
MGKAERQEKEKREKKAEDAEKEAWERVRRQIEHEDDLINNRISQAIQISSMLLVAIAGILVFVATSTNLWENLTNAENSARLWLLFIPMLLFSLAGMVTSFLIYRSVRMANMQVERLFWFHKGMYPDTMRLLIGKSSGRFDESFHSNFASVIPFCLFILWSAVFVGLSSYWVYTITGNASQIVLDKSQSFLLIANYISTNPSPITRDEALAPFFTTILFWLIIGLVLTRTKDKRGSANEKRAVLFKQAFLVIVALSAVLASFIMPARADIMFIMFPITGAIVVFWLILIWVSMSKTNRLGYAIVTFMVGALIASSLWLPLNARLKTSMPIAAFHLGLIAVFALNVWGDTQEKERRERLESKEDIEKYLADEKLKDEKEKELSNFENKLEELKFKFAIDSGFNKNQSSNHRKTCYLNADELLCCWVKFLNENSNLAHESSVAHEDKSPLELDSVAALDFVVGRQYIADAQLYRDIAAELGYALMKYRPFSDANKRFAEKIVELSLNLNGLKLIGSPTELKDHLREVAKNSEKLDDLKDWLKKIYDKVQYPVTP